MGFPTDEKHYDSSPEITTTDLPYNPFTTPRASSGTATPRSLDDPHITEKPPGHLEDGYLSSEKSRSIHDDAVELTPMEAFKRRVDGDESPFPEVQACVPTDDDPSIMINRESPKPCGVWCELSGVMLDFRMWTLLTAFVILFAGVNQFFA
jgi:hypothetical protein